MCCGLSLTSTGYGSSVPRIFCRSISFEFLTVFIRVISCVLVDHFLAAQKDNIREDARLGRTLGDLEWFDKLVGEQASGAFAMVETGDFDAAIDLVAQAVDVLRVLQHVRHFTSLLTQFGIAGDVGRGVVPYIQIDGGRAGHGFSHRGNPLGWTFSDPDEWADAPVFQWAASAIGASSPAESQRRALVGSSCVVVMTTAA